jgi:hypothetical protein
MHIRRDVAAGVVLVVVALLVSSVAAARASLPTPGSAAKISALVAASHTIDKLPKNLVPPLQDAAYDDAANYYPAIRQGCSTATQCVFGDPASSTTIVLFGDSHAAMWLPALVWIGTKLDLRIVLLWDAGCPAATVTVWDTATRSADTSCNEWRETSLGIVEKLDPSLVLLTDRTSEVRGAHDSLISNKVWKGGMEQTIAALEGAGLKVAVIGDITGLPLKMPEWLAAYPTHIQTCSSPVPSHTYQNHFADEMDAAKAQGVPYINPQSWICTKKVCSPVVGDMVAYYDDMHLSATYAEYLSIVMEAAITPLLAKS